MLLVGQRTCPEMEGYCANVVQALKGKDFVTTVSIGSGLLATFSSVCDG